MDYSFKSQLIKGQEGEERFHKLFPNWIRTDGRKEDFFTETGAAIELKTESRTTKQTPNLALELESSPGRPGAIERAVSDGIDYICYLFACDSYFIYKPEQLYSFMIKHKDKYRVVKVKNKTYYTSVLLVPRADVKELLCPYF